MKISPIHLSHNQNIKLRNQKSELKNEQNFSLKTFNNISNINRFFILNNIAFGKNVDVFKKMKKEKDPDKLIELFKTLTQKAQDNVNGVVEHEKLKDENGKPLLTLKGYLPACIEQQQLFYQSPDTIVGHVVGVIDHEKLKDEDGNPLLTLKEYLPACTKQPSLFSQSPDTIVGHVVDVIDHEKLKDEDGNPLLTLKEYLPVCIDQPSLLTISPDTIVSNVVGVVEHEKLKDEDGKPLLTLEEYLPVCIKQPSLFSQSPDTIAEHIKALLFINKDRLYFKEGEIDKNVLIKHVFKRPILLSCTNKLNYSYLLREKMFPMGNPKGVSGSTKVIKKLSDYLSQHPNEKFSFTIIKDDMSKEFIDFANKLAKEATGKDDVFNISCIEIE